MYAALRRWAPPPRPVLAVLVRRALGVPLPLAALAGPQALSVPGPLVRLEVMALAQTVPPPLVLWALGVPVMALVQTVPAGLVLRRASLARRGVRGQRAP